LLNEVPVALWQRAADVVERVKDLGTVLDMDVRVDNGSRVRVQDSAVVKIGVGHCRLPEDGEGDDEWSNGMRLGWQVRQQGYLALREEPGELETSSGRLPETYIQVLRGFIIRILTCIE
jgi:hypothetical protein